MYKDFAVRSNTERFKDLKELTARINSSLRDPSIQPPSLELITLQMLEHALIEVHGSSGSVMTYNPEKGVLRILAGIGIPPSIKDILEVGPGSDKISRKVFDTGHEIFVTDTVEMKAQTQLKQMYYDPNSSGSFMSLPVMTIDGLTGVLNMNAAKGNQFRKVDLSYGLMLSTAIGIVMSKHGSIGKPDLENRDEMITEMAVVGYLSALGRQNAWVFTHSMNVERYTAIIYEIANGKPCPEGLRLAARLHDIGKTGVDDDILNYAGPLGREQRIVMEDHTVTGDAMVSAIDTNGIASGARQHHLRFDGDADAWPNSYPDPSVFGERIHPFARYIAVADAYDAMNSDRPYRSGLSLKEIIEEIRRNKGRQFDPVPAEALIQAHQEGKLAHFH